MSKPILIVTLPGGAAVTDDQLQKLGQQFKNWEDYRVIGVTESSCSRDRVNFRLMNAGFWERLFDYLQNRRQVHQERELDRLRNDCDRLARTNETISAERNELRDNLSRANNEVTRLIRHNLGKPITMSAEEVQDFKDWIKGTEMLDKWKAEPVHLVDRTTQPDIEITATPYPGTRSWDNPDKQTLIDYGVTPAPGEVVTRLTVKKDGPKNNTSVISFNTRPWIRPEKGPQP